MAKTKLKARSRRAIRVPLSDEELIERLQEDAPHVLEATISEERFDKAVAGLLKESPGSRDGPHFYCRKCREYHLKTHPHYNNSP